MEMILAVGDVAELDGEPVFEEAGWAVGQEENLSPFPNRVLWFRGYFICFTCDFAA